MHHRQLLNSEWRKIEESFQKKLSCWKAKYLSYGGRLVLLNSVLNSLPMFTMSFFEIPKGVLKNLDHFKSRFFFCKDLLRNISIDLQNGTFCVILRTKGD